MARKMQTLLSLGSNAPGAWGSSTQALARTLVELQLQGAVVLRVSQIFETEPVGPVRQCKYLNQIVVLKTQKPPAMLLRSLKKLERQAGRRVATSVRWGPRPLDIDIIDQGGRITAHQPIKRGRSPSPAITPLVLPHPQAHLRSFVLVPLLQIVPHWWHPMLRQTGRQLLSRLAQRHDVKPT